MQRLKLIKVIGLILFSLSTLVTFAEDDLSGLWNGYFGYDNQPLSNGEAFSMVVVQKNGSLKGEIIEVDFSTQFPEVLGANVNGVMNDNKVVFFKKYDGKGKREHSVKYELSFYSDDNSGVDILVGRWSIGQNASGPAAFYRFPKSAYLKIISAALTIDTGK